MALACCGCAESCARAETAWLGIGVGVGPGLGLGVGVGLGLGLGLGVGLGLGSGELREGWERLQLLVLLARLQLVGQHHEASALEELLRGLHAGLGFG